MGQSENELPTRENKILRNGVYGVNGFMSSSVYGVQLAMECFLTQAERLASLDWRVVPLPWQTVKLNRNLRIGYYTDDTLFPPTPGVSRAVREVVQLLADEGHSVEPWTPPQLGDLFRIFTNFLLADKGHYAVQNMKGEITDKAIEVNMLNFRCPKRLKTLICHILR